MPNYPSRANHVDKTHPYKQNSRAHANCPIAICQQSELTLTSVVTANTKRETSQHHFFFKRTKHSSFHHPAVTATAMASNSAAKAPCSGVDAPAISLFFKTKPKTFPKLDLAATMLHNVNTAAEVPPPPSRILSYESRFHQKPVVAATALVTQSRSDPCCILE
jgi:hypothetical protein